MPGRGRSGESSGRPTSRPSRSMTMTAWPRRARSRAAAIPATPAPITTIRRPATRGRVRPERGRGEAFGPEAYGHGCGRTFADEPDEARDDPGGTGDRHPGAEAAPAGVRAQRRLGRAPPGRDPE